MALGGLKLFHATRDGHGWFGGLCFVAFGSWMLVERMTYIQIDARQLWPLFLVAIGGYMVWRGSHRAARRGRGRRPLAFRRHGDPERRQSRQQLARLRGGDLTAIMGGCDIDLRQAAINGEAVIDVFAVWGGIESGA